MQCDLFNDSNLGFYEIVNNLLEFFFFLINKLLSKKKKLIKHRNDIKILDNLFDDHSRNQNNILILHKLKMYFQGRVSSGKITNYTIRPVDDK